MLKWIESTGRSEEAAIQAALDKLGLDRDDVSVEVLERARTGFLGIGSCPAKVRVSYEGPDEPEAVQEEPKSAAPEEPKSVPASGEQATARQSQRRSEPKAEKKPTAPKAPAPAAAPAEPVVEEGDEKAREIADFLTGLLERMGVQAAPSVRRGEENIYEVVLLGEHLGGIIGRRGETLDAIQQITNYAINRGQSERFRVHVDAEGYRARREESLERLAQKVAGKVVKYRRNMTLEPMNAYERHVIHAALQEYPGVTTYSIGTEPNRRTVVAYSREEK